MLTPEAFIERLARARRVPEPVVVVIAHPDDETLGMGGALPLLDSCVVVQLTDGALETDPYRASVRSARAAERAAAARAGGWACPVVDCDVPDQQAHRYWLTLLGRLQYQLAGADVVVTHPYEGGHPDHDTAAWLVQAACDRLGPEAPARVEFASYHRDGTKRVAGNFWPLGAGTEVRLHGARQAGKRAAMAAYTSQASVTRWFDPRVERYRPAPRYDFTAPPPPPQVAYEMRRGAWITGAAWRETVGRAGA